MKYFFALLVPVLAVILTLGSQSDVTQKMVDHSPVSKIAVAAPASPSSEPSSEIENIAAQISRLNKEVEDLHHELSMVGYPEVMLDERLSDQERINIVHKVLTASQKSDRIALLKLRKVDLEADTW